MAKESGARQGATVPCPWQYGKTSLGKPGKMAAEGKQGDASMYRGIKQGKFSGDNYCPDVGHAGSTQRVTWPNRTLVKTPRMR